MSQDTPPKTPKKPPQTREDRLKAALKSNMGRRKAQARARSASPDTTKEGKGPAQEQ